MCENLAIFLVDYMPSQADVFRVSQSWQRLMQRLWALSVLTCSGMMLTRARSLTLALQQGMSISSATEKLPYDAAQRRCTAAQNMCRPQNAPGSIAVTGQDMPDSTSRQAAPAAQLRVYSRSIRLEMYCASDLLHSLSR